MSLIDNLTEEGLVKLIAEAYKRGKADAEQEAIDNFQRGLTQPVRYTPNPYAHRTSYTWDTWCSATTSLSGQEQ